MSKPSTTDLQKVVADAGSPLEALNAALDFQIKTLTLLKSEYQTAWAQLSRGKGVWPWRGYIKDDAWSRIGERLTRAKALSRKLDFDVHQHIPVCSAKHCRTHVIYDRAWDSVGKRDVFVAYDKCEFHQWRHPLVMVLEPAVEQQKDSDAYKAFLREVCALKDSYGFPPDPRFAKYSETPRRLKNHVIADIAWKHFLPGEENPFSKELAVNIGRVVSVGAAVNPGRA